MTADHHRVRATTAQSRIAGRLLRSVGDRDVPSAIEQTCAVACPHGPCASLFHPVMVWLLTQLGLLLHERVGADAGESFAFEVLTGAQLWSEPTALSDDALDLRIRVLAALSAEHTPPPWAPQTTGASASAPPERVRMLLDALLWLDDLLDDNV